MRLVKCAYCGSSEELTKDHIPPEKMFAKPRPSNLITVPCCEKCRNDTSNDDEYFKTVITLRDVVGNHPDVKRILPSTARSLMKVNKWKFYLNFINKTRWIEEKTEDGLILGKKLGYEVDFSRIYKVINRIVRGLYYNESNTILPSTVEVRSTALEALNKKDYSLLKGHFLKQLLTREKHTIGLNVFSYVYDIQEKDPYVSVWLLEFYEKIDFFAMTNYADSKDH